MSKELEALEPLEALDYLTDIAYGRKMCYAPYDLEQIVKKALKALEIIKEKRINVGDFKRCKGLEDYNDYCCYSEKEQLTQEEFDLLKEVLK